MRLLGWEQGDEEGVQPRTPGGEAQRKYRKKGHGFIQEEPMAVEWEVQEVSPEDLTDDGLSGRPLAYRVQGHQSLESSSPAMGDKELLPEKFHFVSPEAATSRLTPAELLAPIFPDAYSGMGRGPGEKEKSVERSQVGVEHALGWVESWVDEFSDRLCKSSPKGGLFPLPTSSSVLSSLFPLASPTVVSFLRSLVVSLNSLNDERTFCESVPSSFQNRVLTNLLSSCELVSSWNVQCSDFSWDEFLSVRTIDYKGDEVRTAQKISWESISPALPDEVGKVALSDVVQLGSLHYVTHFDDNLLDVDDQVYVKPPRVMVDECHWEELCAKLLERGVFRKVHEDDLFTVAGKPVLNGLFGVSKDDFTPTGVEVMRLIMNLTPINACCRAIDSDIATLPSWASFSPMELLDGEDLVVSSEDVRCFF